MSEGFVPFTLDRPTMIECLFCEKPGNLVLDPDEDAYNAIKDAADERQDATRDKFYFLYDDSLSRQCFSWHLDCATSYISFDGNNQRERSNTVSESEIKIKPEEEIEVEEEGVRIITEDLLTQINSPEEIPRCLICDQQLHLTHSKTHPYKSRLSAAKIIYGMAHRIRDSVFMKICRYHSPEDMIDKGIHYHKSCYFNYVRQPNRCQKKRLGHISRKDLYKGLKKLLDEIHDKLTSTCFQMSFLAKRLAKLTEVKGAEIDEETVKKLLKARYGGRLLFSYPAGLDSCVVFLSSVPLGEAMKRLASTKFSDKDNNKNSPNVYNPDIF